MDQASGMVFSDKVRGLFFPTKFFIGDMITIRYQNPLFMSYVRFKF